MEFYYENEAEQFEFYRIPKLLFKDKRFSEISSDTKLLYALLLNRVSLSQKNGWVDENKRVYIYFSVWEIMDELNICSEKCTKIMSELDEQKGCGLIQRKRQGQGRPSKIYVMKFTSQNTENDDSLNTNADTENDEECPQRLTLQKSGKSNFKTFENRNVIILKIIKRLLIMSVVILILSYHTGRISVKQMRQRNADCTLKLFEII